jgi:hypothetical protein
MTAGFILRAFAVLFNVVSLILICVVSFAGINETIEHIYWLKVNGNDGFHHQEAPWLTLLAGRQLQTVNTFSAFQLRVPKSLI